MLIELEPILAQLNAFYSWVLDKNWEIGTPNFYELSIQFTFSLLIFYNNRGCQEKGSCGFQTPITSFVRRYVGIVCNFLLEFRFLSIMTTMFLFHSFSSRLWNENIELPYCNGTINGGSFVFRENGKTPTSPHWTKMCELQWKQGRKNSVIKSA